MKILTLFCGNFGIEYNLFDFTDKQLTNLITGIITDIGSRTADNRYECKGISKHDIREVSNVIAALKWINDTLVKEGFITTPDDIDAVVHRVIHGLTKYRKELVKVTPEVIDDVLEFADFAPEHNPYNAEGMKQRLRFIHMRNSLHFLIPHRLLTYPQRRTCMGYRISSTPNTTYGGMGSMGYHTYVVSAKHVNS